MKKLLSVLSMFLLTTGVPSTVFSCSTVNKKESSKFDSSNWKESLSLSYDNNNYNNIIVAPKNAKLHKDDKSSKSIYSDQIKNIFGSKFIKEEQQKFNKWFDNSDISIQFLSGIWESDKISLNDSKNDSVINTSHFINTNGYKSVTLTIIVSEKDKSESPLDFKVNLYDDSYKFLNDNDNTNSVKVDDIFPKPVANLSKKYNDKDDALISISQGFYNQYKVEDENTKEQDVFNKLVVSTGEYNQNNFEWVIFAQDLFSDVQKISRQTNIDTYNSLYFGKFLNGYDEKNSSIIDLSDWIFTKLNNNTLSLKFIPDNDKKITSLNQLFLLNKDESKKLGFHQNRDI